VESTISDNSRGNKLDPQWKKGIRKAKTKMGDRDKSDLQMLLLINGEELANDREA